MDPENSKRPEPENIITETAEDSIPDEGIESLEDLLFSDDYDEEPDNPEVWLTEAAAQVPEEEEEPADEAAAAEEAGEAPAPDNGFPVENEEENPFQDRLGIDYSPEHSQIEREKRAFNKSFLEQKKAQRPENLPLGKLKDNVTAGTLEGDSFQEKKASLIQPVEKALQMSAQRPEKCPEFTGIRPEGSLRQKDAATGMKGLDALMRAGVTLQFSGENSGPVKMPMEFRPGGSSIMQTGALGMPLQPDTVMRMQEGKASRVWSDVIPVDQPKRTKTEEDEKGTKPSAKDEGPEKIERREKPDKAEKNEQRKKPVQAKKIERRRRPDHTENVRNRLKPENLRPTAKRKDQISLSKKTERSQRKTVKAGRFGSVEPKAPRTREDALAFKEAPEKRPENKVKKDGPVKERTARPPAERVRKKTVKAEDMFLIERKPKSRDAMQFTERKTVSRDSQMSMDSGAKKKKENMFDECGRL